MRNHHFRMLCSYRYRDGAGGEEVHGSTGENVKEVTPHVYNSSIFDESENRALWRKHRLQQMALK